MTDFQHRVRVFVFGFHDRRPEYLLLRRTLSPESFWTPLHGPIGFGEKLETAVQREVVQDTGLGRMDEVIDLQMQTNHLLGDEYVVEWTYAVRATDSRRDLVLDETWAAYRWSSMENAYPALEFDADRAALVRLHTMLSAA